MDEIPHQSGLLKTTFIVIGILLVSVIVAASTWLQAKNTSSFSPILLWLTSIGGLFMLTKKISIVPLVIGIRHPARPNFSAVYYNRGIAYANTGETQNAIADFKKSWNSAVLMKRYARMPNKCYKS